MDIERIFSNIRTPLRALAPLACAVLVLPSCMDGAEPDGPREVVLAVGGSFEARVDTRATAVTSVPSTLYWGATTGTRGSSEALKAGAAQKGVTSGKLATGLYQTATPTSYNHYVSNVTFTVPSTGNVTMSATNTTDVVCGWAATTSSSAPSVALDHIFARTGTLTATAPSGFTASNVSWKVVGKSAVNGTAGTYNLSTGAWTAASTKLTAATALTSSSDMYLIPGTYTVTVTYTLTKGDNVQTYTKSGDVNLAAGKTNNISCTLLTNTVSEISIGLTLTAWGSEAVTLTLG